MYFDGSYNETDHGDYVEIVPHNHVMCQIETGDVVENYHFNTGASSGTVQMNAGVGTGSYEVRNIAWTGGRVAGDNYALTPTSTGTGLFENIWLGDGCAAYPVSPGNHNAYPGGVWVDPGHTGTLIFRGVYFQNWIDNALYASAPGDVGGNANATIGVENCYAVENIVAAYRFGSDDYITNSYADTPTTRGIWAKYGSYCDLEMTDTQISSSGGTSIIVGSGTTVRAQDSAWDSLHSDGQFVDNGGNTTNPQEFMPAGCPTSPEEAYLGDPGGGGGARFDPLSPVDPGSYAHTIPLRGTAHEENHVVELWLDTDDPNDAEWTADYGATLEPTDLAELGADDANNGWVRAACNLWSRDSTNQDGGGETSRRALRTNAPVIAMRFNENVFDLDVTPVGTAQVEQDGEVLDPDSYPTTPDQEPPEPDDPRIETGDASEIETNSVRLAGAVNSLNGWDEIYVAFRLRHVDEDGWPVAGQLNRVTSSTNVRQRYPREDDGYPNEYFESDHLYEYEFVGYADSGSNPAVDAPDWSGRTRTFRTASESRPTRADELEAPPIGVIWYVDEPNSAFELEDDQ